MADIEKGLPDTKLPATGELNAVDVDVNVEEIQKGPIEVTPEEDGGATIDFDPNANLKIPGTESHFDNLADLLPDEVIDPIGSDLRFQYQDNKTSSVQSRSLTPHGHVRTGDTFTRGCIFPVIRERGAARS